MRISVIGTSACALPDTWVTPFASEKVLQVRDCVPAVYQPADAQLAPKLLSK